MAAHSRYSGLEKAGGGRVRSEITRVACRRRRRARAVKEQTDETRVERKIFQKKKKKTLVSGARVCPLPGPGVCKIDNKTRLNIIIRQRRVVLLLCYYITYTIHACVRVTIIQIDVCRFAYNIIFCVQNLKKKKKLKS